MSFPFAVVFYENDIIVGTRFGNHGLFSPNELQKAKSIIGTIEGTDWDLEPFEKEWTHMIAGGRVFFRPNYEKMKQIVSLIDDFKLAGFSFSYAKLAEINQ